MIIKISPFPNFHNTIQFGRKTPQWQSTGSRWQQARGSRLCVRKVPGMEVRDKKGPIIYSHSVHGMFLIFDFNSINSTHDIYHFIIWILKAAC